MLYQHKFLTALLERLDNKDTAQTVIDDFYKLRNELTKADSMSLHIAANWSKLSEMNMDLTTPWLKLAKEQVASKEK